MDLFVEGLEEVKHACHILSRCSNLQGPQIHWLTTVLLFTICVPLILKHPQVVCKTNSLEVCGWISLFKTGPQHVCSPWTCKVLKSWLSQPRGGRQINGGPSFPFQPCPNLLQHSLHETADEMWLNMKHGHTSKGYDMPWVSEFLWTIDCSCWLCQTLCAWCLWNWWPSNLHFFASDAVMLPHVCFIQIPRQSTRRSRRFQLHWLCQASAQSFR